MNVIRVRLLALLLVFITLLPLLAGCGKTQKAMETPDGLSNSQRRDQKNTGQ